MIRRWTVRVGFLALLLLGFSGSVHAQKKEVLPPEPKAYKLQYSLAILGIGLGIYVTVRPGNRDTKVNVQREE